MEVKGKPIEILLAGVHNAGSGHAHIYLPGTTTDKTIYTDAALSSAASNPVSLDSNGRALVFTDGLVKVVVHDSGGGTAGTWDYLDYFNRFSGAWIDARNYNDGGLTDTTIAAAQTAMGSGEGTILIAPGTWNINNNLTIGASKSLHIVDGAILNVASEKTLTIEGKIEAGLYQIFSGGGRVVITSKFIRELYPQWWGAKGDNSADNWGPIQAALDTAYDDNYDGGDSKIVFIPNGTYLVSDQLKVRTCTIVQGAGSRSTVIKANGNFPQNTAVFDLGFRSTATFVHSTEIRDLMIHCNDIAGSVGIQSSTINEQAGVRNVVVLKYMSKGIYVHTDKSGNFMIENFELFRSKESHYSIGIHLNGCGGVCNVKYGTINPIEAPTYITGETAIKVESTGLFVDNIHVEKHGDGIIFASGSFGQVIGYSGYQENNNQITPNCINIQTGAGSIFTSFILKNGSRGNTIVNSITGNTYTEGVIPFYGFYSGSNTESVLGSNGLITTGMVSAMGNEFRSVNGSVDARVGAQAFAINQMGIGTVSNHAVKIYTYGTLGVTVDATQNTQLEGHLTVGGATPSVGTGKLGIGTTNGMGNGGAVTVTTLSKSTGSGPSYPHLVNNYLKIYIGSTAYWIPIMQ